MTSPFFGEFMGTAVLILLGNGVVANVLLKKSKGEGGGWMVIASGWAFAVLMGVITAVARRHCWCDAGLATILATLERDCRPFTEACLLFDRTCYPESSYQRDQRNHRNVCSSLRRRRYFF